MMGLTICQPYAHLIVLGEKPIENRTWFTSYRGDLLIHAGKSKAWLDEDDRNLYPEMVFGAAVGVAQLVACLKLDATWPERWAHLQDHEHANGPFCWVLEHVRRFDRPVPCSGSQGLWRISDSLQRLVA